MSEVSEYRIAVGELKQLSARERQVKEEIQTAMSHIRYDIYRPLIHELENKRDDEIRRKEAEGKTLQNLIDLDRSRYTGSVSKVDRILKLMRLSDDGLRELAPISGDHVINGGHFIICNDQYKKVFVYIATTRKPKNKYSLVVEFKSAFVHGFFSSDRIIGSSRSLRDAPTKEQLIAWYRKNGLPSDIQGSIDRHILLEQEFESAKLLFNDAEWLKLYLESMKTYYEEQYHQGTETKEYRSILRRLKKFGIPSTSEKITEVC